MLLGAPGAGKTTAALQFLGAGVEAGERCIYVSLSQTAAELESIATSHGWTMDGIRIEELSASDAVNGAADQTICQTAELRLDETRQAIEQAIDEYKPSRLAYDSLLEIRLITGDTPRFRRELIGFKAFLAKRPIWALGRRPNPTPFQSCKPSMVKTGVDQSDARHTRQCVGCKLASLSFVVAFIQPPSIRRQGIQGDECLDGQ